MYSVFSTPGCVQCRAAKALLKGKEIAYNEFLLDTPDQIESFKERYPGVRSMPLVLDDKGDVIGDYSRLLAHVKGLK